MDTTEKKTVKIFADSTCDLSDEQIAAWDITIIPLCIILDDKSYFDKTELTPAQIFEWADEHKRTPMTAAVTMDYTHKLLAPHMRSDEDVIFFGISSDMSTTCNVVRLASEEFESGRVYVIDSRNLSTGIGLQVLRAAKMAKEGKTAKEIVQSIEAARGLVRASFIVDTLTYLARGGRCSSATALLANTLRLHPCIKVIDGKMEVGKKYRGSLVRALQAYVNDLKPELEQASPERVFITHSGVDAEIVEEVRNFLASMNYFDEIIETRAGGVISSHCGPGTLGVLFYAK